MTNRIESSELTIGGKGTHVSINLKQMGENSNVFGICHGEAGKEIINLLQAHGLSIHFIHEEASQTRTNYLLIESNGDCTIIAEKGVQLAEDDLQNLIDDMIATIQYEDYLILSGDASNCQDPMIYNKLLILLKEKKLKVFLDTSGVSLKLCIKESPFLIKPNLEELATLCNRPVSMNDKDIIAAIHSLDPHHVEIVAVSLGGNGSVIKTPEGIYRAYPPKVDVINTIGCGDCFLAGFAFGISKHLSMEDTIRMATAVSAATAESKSSVGFNKTRAEELIPLVKIMKINEN